MDKSRGVDISHKNAILKKRENSMPFKKGHKKPPNSGRAKGVPNKLPAKYREDQDWVYGQLGGKEGWFEFVAKNTFNRAQFYRGIEKRIPAPAVAVDVSGEVKHDAKLTIEVVQTKNDS